MNTRRCQICPKQAYFNCSRCQKSYYCSKDHQIQHWKSQHRTQCKASQKPKLSLDTLFKKRSTVRKQYFQNYSNKVFDLCLLDAKVLIDFQKSIKEATNDVMDQFQYGATVCLLCRSYILVNNNQTARLTLQNYIQANKGFLQSFDNLPDLSKTFTNQQKQLFQRKMNLLSTIANLQYILEMQCIKHYVLYTKHIEYVYGKNSLQASNCYFLIGCYFAEEGFFKKSIACFSKAAACRGELAGDCYFNIGILFAYQKKYVKALDMFQLALKLRMGQYGQDSEQIAEVHQNTGLIYVELNDFITAMMQYEKSFKIRVVNQYSAPYSNLIQLIHQLYDKLCLFISSEQQQLKKPSIFLHLKTKIQDQDVYWRQKQSKRQSMKREILEETQKKVAINASINSPLRKTKKTDKFMFNAAQKGKNQGLLVISEKMMNAMSQTELFLLSEMQLQLQTCNSLYSSVYMIGKSLFLKQLSPENYKTLVEDNPRLFELLRLENIRQKA